MTVLYVARLERSFRRAAGLDIDKEKLRRYSDFVHRKNYDLLVRGDDQELALEPIPQAAKWRWVTAEGRVPRVCAASETGDIRSGDDRGNETGEEEVAIDERRGAAR